MNVVYKMQADGGFLAGDMDSGIACYAYPTSNNATQAKETPQRVAEKMIRNELALKFRHDLTRQRDAMWIAELIEALAA